MAVDKKFKVLHVATSTDGGAGIASVRMHESLLRLGVGSKLLVMSGLSRKSNEIRRVPFKWLGKALNVGVRCLYRCFGNYRFLNEAKGLLGEFEIFTTPITMYRVENHPWVKEADIIHLHWVANFLNLETFFKAIKGKKVVWTLHDMNPFMGGFHYLGDKIRNPQLEDVEVRFWNVKERAYKNLDVTDYRVIYLNSWMKNIAQRNVYFKRLPSCTIPNSIDFNIFTPHPKHEVRDELSLPQNKKVILFACQSLDSSRKGFDILLEALRLLDSKGSNVTLLTFGSHSENLNLRGIKSINIGAVSDSRLMAKLYSCADLFVLPSREDNLPNVMLESWACGTPLVCFSNGGMADFVKEGLNGEIVQNLSANELCKSIERVLASSYDSKAIVSEAELHFSPEIVGKRMIDEVYKDLMISSP